MDLHLAAPLVPPHGRQVPAPGGFGPARARRPRPVGRQRTVQRDDLAQLAAPVRIPFEQFRPVHGVLASHGELWAGTDQRQVVAVHDRVSSTDCLSEMVTGINKNHRDVRADPGQHVDEHSLRHGCGHNQLRPELLHRPAQDLLRGRALQLVTGMQGTGLQRGIHESLSSVVTGRQRRDHAFPTPYRGAHSRITAKTPSQCSQSAEPSCSDEMGPTARAVRLSRKARRQLPHAHCPWPDPLAASRSGGR